MDRRPQVAARFAMNYPVRYQVNEIEAISSLSGPIDRAHQRRAGRPESVGAWLRRIRARLSGQNNYAASL